MNSIHVGPILYFRDNPKTSHNTMPGKIHRMSDLGGGGHQDRNLGTDRRSEEKETSKARPKRSISASDPSNALKSSIAGNQTCPTYVDRDFVRRKRIEYLKSVDEKLWKICEENTLKAKEYIFGLIMASSESLHIGDLYVYICIHAFSHADIEDIEKTLKSAGYKTILLNHANFGRIRLCGDVAANPQEDCGSGCRIIHIRNTWKTGVEEAIEERQHSRIPDA